MGRKLTTAEFLEKAKHVHGNRYDYSQVDYQGGHTYVKIICREHGVFEQTPHNHLKGKGCPRCCKTQRLTRDVFIEKARQIHGDVYDYSEVEYLNNRTKVRIICSEHGIFEQVPNAHLQMGAGCPKCAMSHKVQTCLYKYGVTSYTKTPMFLEQVRTTCLEKYGVDNPVKVDAFAQKMYATKLDRGSYNTSQPEDDFYEMLVQKFGKHDVLRQYQSELYPFRCDFYVKSLDLYIELNCTWTHGGHFFDPNCKADVMMLQDWKLKADTSEYYKKAVYVWSIRDVMKRDAAVSNSLNYLVFWKNDLSDAIEWLDSV